MINTLNYKKKMEMYETLDKAQKIYKAIKPHYRKKSIYSIYKDLQRYITILWAKINCMHFNMFYDDVKNAKLLDFSWIKFMVDNIAEYNEIKAYTK